MQVRARHVNVDGELVRVFLDDGREIAVPVAWFPRLAGATPAQRQNWELLGRGVGIRWPDVDEDISVGGRFWGHEISPPVRSSPLPPFRSPMTTYKKGAGPDKMTTDAAPRAVEMGQALLGRRRARLGGRLLVIMSISPNGLERPRLEEVEVKQQDDTDDQNDQHPNRPDDGPD